MSLRYDLRQIKDRDTSDKGFMVTEMIIWGCLDTHIGQITKANYEEWWIRYQTVTQIAFPGTKNRISLEDVRNHIGLYTNVAPKTRLQWFKAAIEPRMAFALQAEREHLAVIDNVKADAN